MIGTVELNELIPFNLSILEEIRIQDPWWLLLATIPLLLLVVHFKPQNILAAMRWGSATVKHATVVVGPKWPRHMGSLLTCLLILLLVYPAAKPVHASHEIREEALLIWVYDASASMSTVDVQEEDGGKISRLDASVVALEESLEQVPTDIHKILISFSDLQRIEVGLPTLNNDELLKQARSIVQGERTATDYALEQAFSACKQFFNDRDNHPCVIFLLSDGECNPRPQCRLRSKDLTLEANTKGVTIHTISWGNPESDFRPNPHDMAEIAEAGQGRHLISADTSELTQLYNNVVKGIETQTIFQPLAASYVWIARVVISLLTLMFFLKRIE